MVDIILPEYLTVVSEACASPAFWHEDLSPLLSESDRGDNEDLPYVDGLVAFRGWLDQIDATVNWFVNGFRDEDGSPHSDPLDGLDENIEHYRALFRDNADEDTGLTAISLVSGARTLTGYMQCRRWVVVRTSDTTATVVTRLVIPAGRLTGS